jgi:hypothetical protein
MSRIQKSKQFFCDTIKLLYGTGIINVKGRCVGNAHRKERKQCCESGSIWIQELFKSIPDPAGTDLKTA